MQGLCQVSAQQAQKCSYSMSNVSCLVAKLCLTLLQPHGLQPTRDFPRQENWRGLPFPVPGDLPDSMIKPVSPALAGSFLFFVNCWATWEAQAQQAHLMVSLPLSQILVDQNTLITKLPCDLLAFVQLRASTGLCCPSIPLFTLRSENRAPWSVFLTVVSDLSRVPLQGCPGCWGPPHKACFSDPPWRGGLAGGWAGQIALCRTTPAFPVP